MDVDPSVNVENETDGCELVVDPELELVEFVELDEPVRPGGGNNGVTPSRFKNTDDSSHGIARPAADDCEVLSVVGGGEIAIIVELPVGESLLRLLLVEVPLSFVGATVTKVVWKAVWIVVLGVSVLMLTLMPVKKLGISPVGCGPGEKQSDFSIVSMKYS